MTAGPATGRLRLRALDVRLDLHVEDASLAWHLEVLLGDLLAAEPVGRADVPLLVTGTGPWCITSPAHATVVTSWEGATSAVLAAVNLTTVASTRLLAVHAAVVTRDDRVLVVPAASGTGKSTLTACLLARGWSYVSDESLSLRWDDGSVVPYPRPMALSGWAAGMAGVQGSPGHDGTTAERVVAVGAEGWHVATAVGAPTEVLLLSRRDGPPTLEPVARQEVVVELLRRSFTHFLDPARSLRLLSAVTGAARCRRLHLGDPRAAAALLDHPDA